MAQGKFVAYYRVSTERQGRSGLGLEAQQEAVRDYLNGGSWQLVAEVVEVESGKRSDRPKLAEALRLCRMHGEPSSSSPRLTVSHVMLTSCSGWRRPALIL